MKFLEFFSEANGTLSNIRLNATMLIFCGCMILVYPVIQGKTIDANSIAAAGLLITSGLGGKLIQKGQEEKPDTDSYVSKV
jgi:hypothetical protein